MRIISPDWCQGPLITWRKSWGNSRTIWNLSNWSHRNRRDHSGKAGLGRREEVNYRFLESNRSRGRINSKTHCKEKRYRRNRSEWYYRRQRRSINCTQSFSYQELMDTGFRLCFWSEWFNLRSWSTKTILKIQKCIK